MGEEWGEFAGRGKAGLRVRGRVQDSILLAVN